MADYIYKDGELCHYGVPGMKWGVRKARPESSGRGRFGLRRKPNAESGNQTDNKPVKKRKLSELSDKEIQDRIARMELEKRYIDMAKGRVDSKAAKKKAAPAPQKRKLSELSDEEIQAKIDRMNLEKKYKELAQQTNPPKSSEGRDYALDIIKTIGKNSLTNIGTQMANKLLGVTINKAFGVDSYDTQKRIVNPNKGQTDKK